AGGSAEGALAAAAGVTAAAGAVSGVRTAPAEPAHPPSGKRSGRGDQKGSASRWRFHPPPPLAFRPGLAASPYDLRKRLRLTRAPCSLQPPRYEMCAADSRAGRG